MTRVKQTAGNGIGKGTPGPGRPKGSKNRLTVAAKDAFQTAFDELGGVENLVKWAKSDPDNLGDFYKLYARMIPLEHTVDPDAPIELALTDVDVARRIAFVFAKAMRQQETPSP